jgi:hypothetical protein
MNWRPSALQRQMQRFDEELSYFLSVSMTLANYVLLEKKAALNS